MPNANHDIYQDDILETQSPSFTIEQVKDIANQLYGLTGKLFPLASERDQNFRITTEVGDQFVIKIANSAEDPAIIDMQLKALEHIAIVDPKLPVPEVLFSRSGLAIEQIKAENGANHSIRVLTYLSGAPAKDDPTDYALPIALPLLLTGISVTFWDIASGLVYLILIPLALSLFVRARYPEAAGSTQPLFAQASNLSLLILMVLMVVLNFSNVVGLLGSGGLLASLILVILTTAGGYLLGKLGKAGDWLQALGAGQRNIAAAMVVATMNFGNDEVVMVVVYSLIVLVVLIPLALELGKRAAK